MPLLKYNPGMLGEAELIESFVVRQRELEMLLETIQENTGQSNQHILVIGQRGSGKTTLVRRVAAEIRSVSSLSELWYPVVFAEEPYLVSSAGELWLEAIFHLAEQTNEQRWEKTYQDLKKEPNEAHLRERALARLLDFADEQKKRILLIIENLDMLFQEQMSENTDWELRHTLLNEPRLMLLGTATTRFDEIENVSKAWFELFSIYELKPLKEKECQELWKARTGEDTTNKQLRPVEILTGGNPRLLSILASFASKRSFRNLMDDLIQLIDDHTEYFKSQLDGLAATERKVFVALLDIWDPASAREISEVTRLDVNKVSSLLKRLEQRGAITLVRTQSNKHFYQASERLYNIYYLMRRRGHATSRVSAAVRFMVQFYEGEQLVDTFVELAKEACTLNPQQRQEHYLAIVEFLNQGNIDSKSKLKLIQAIPKPFFTNTDIPEQIRQTIELWLKSEFTTSLQELERVSKELHSFFKKDVNGNLAWVVFSLVLVFVPSSRVEVEKACRKILELAPNHSLVWGVLGTVLYFDSGRYKEAEQAYLKALELNPKDSFIWALLAGMLFHLGRYQEAEEPCHRAIEIDPDNGLAWMVLGIILHIHRKDYKKAEQAYLKAIELKQMLVWPYLLQLRLEQGKSPSIVFQQAEQVIEELEYDPDGLGRIVWSFYKLGAKEYFPKLETWLSKAVGRYNSNWELRFTLVTILGVQGKWEEALQITPVLLDASEDKRLAQITDFITTVAAAGYAKEALEVIVNSKLAEALEILEVGLRIFLGEAPLKAQEIMGVAQDIVKSIREKQAKQVEG